MLNYIVRLICCGAAVYYMPNFLSKIHVEDYTTAVIVAFVMSILNAFVKPVLQLLSLPLTILTLGIFYLVVNVVVVYLCASLVSGFKVDGFLQPLIFGFILSVVNSIVGGFQD
ncbi:MULTISPECIES: phage holin family protein [Emticicia]|uniref:phage holin family protein n=1 Tax=Emticicia TaxID=312278 RepID=UPI00209D2DC4|nr:MULTISPECIES: phage holin family protein [Emticicia]UTA68705.1 phage holin family protein [Emticicia sp. 21SJ11W-3]